MSSPRTSPAPYPRKAKLQRFMRQAQFIAQEFSKDPSTKVGALLLDPHDYTLLTQGYNGMPRGVDESVSERQLRPQKYLFYEHAERNAIYNRARSILKGSSVVTTEVPGLSCARAVISVGASEIVFPEPAAPSAELQVALELFHETNVRVRHSRNARVIGDGTVQPGRHERKLGQFAAYALQSARLLSKDPHASAALFLAADDYTQLSLGYSGMPRGADDSRVERYELQERDAWVEGPIRNAVYNAVRAHLKGSVALVTATTCVECARALAAVGATKVYYVEPDKAFKQRWGASIGAGLAMLAELGVEVEALSCESAV